MIRRREFITMLGGAAAWPLVARAQQPGGMRRIGVLTSAGLNDADAQARYAAFVEGLEQLGWTEGRNIRIEARWASGMSWTFVDTSPNWSRLRRTRSW